MFNIYTVSVGHPVFLSGMLLLIWRVDTVGIVVVFGRENMAVVLAQTISKMTVIWGALCCYINLSSTPVEDDF